MKEASTKAEIEVPHLNSHFRGRALKGIEYKLPDKIMGINIVHSAKPNQDEIEWHAVSNFDKITFWEHDIDPNLSKMNEYMEWFVKQYTPLTIYGIILYYGSLYVHTYKKYHHGLLVKWTPM